MCNIRSISKSVSSCAVTCLTSQPLHHQSLLYSLFIVNALRRDDDVKVDEKLTSLLRRLIMLNNDGHPEKVRNVSVQLQCSIAAYCCSADLGLTL